MTEGVMGLTSNGQIYELRNPDSELWKLVPWFCSCPKQALGRYITGAPGRRDARSNEGPDCPLSLSAQGS